MKKTKILLVTTLSLLTFGSLSNVFSANADNSERAGKKEHKVKKGHEKYKQVKIEAKATKSEKSTKRSSSVTADVSFHNFSDCPITVTIVDSDYNVVKFSMAAHDDYYIEDAVWIGDAAFNVKSNTCNTDWGNFNYTFRSYENLHVRVDNYGVSKS